MHCGLGFFSVQKFGEERLVAAQHKPWDGGGGALFDAAIRILQDVLQGIMRLIESGGADADRHGSFAFQQRRVHAGGEIVDGFRAEFGITHFAHFRHGMRDLQCGLGSIIQGGTTPGDGPGAPFPFGSAEFCKHNRIGHGGGFIRFQADFLFPDFWIFGSMDRGWNEESLLVNEVGGVIELERDLDLATVWRGVVHHRLQQCLIAKTGKARHHGIDHERLVDGEGGFPVAKEIRAADSDGHETIAREIVRCCDAGSDLALGIGHCRGQPERCHDEILPQFDRCAVLIAPAADDKTLVAALAHGEFFGQQVIEGGVVLDRQWHWRMEELTWIGSQMIHQAEHALIHGIKCDFTAGDGLAFVISDRGRDGKGFGRLHFRFGGIDGDRQFLGV